MIEIYREKTNILIITFNRQSFEQSSILLDKKPIVEDCAKEYNAIETGRQYEIYHRNFLSRMVINGYFTTVYERLPLLNFLPYLLSPCNCICAIKMAKRREKFAHVRGDRVWVNPCCLHTGEEKKRKKKKINGQFSTLMKIQSGTRGSSLLVRARQL